MIFYFTVSSVYSFGKNFSHRRKVRKNGKLFAQRQAGCRFISSRRILFYDFIYFAGFFRQKSEKFNWYLSYYLRMTFLMAEPQNS